MAKTSVIAKLTTQPGKRDDVLAVFEKFVVDTVNDEAGTEIYSFHLDPNDDTVLWVVELYTDKAAFDAHAGSEGFMGLLGTLGPLMGGAPEMHVLEAVSAKGLSL